MPKEIACCKRKPHWKSKLCPNVTLCDSCMAEWLGMEFQAFLDLLFRGPVEGRIIPRLDNNFAAIWS